MESFDDKIADKALHYVWMIMKDYYVDQKNFSEPWLSGGPLV